MKTGNRHAGIRFSKNHTRPDTRSVGRYRPDPDGIFFLPTHQTLILLKLARSPIVVGRAVFIYIAKGGNI